MKPHKNCQKITHRRSKNFVMESKTFLKFLTSDHICLKLLLKSSNILLFQKPVSRIILTETIPNSPILFSNTKVIYIKNIFFFVTFDALKEYENQVLNDIRLERDRWKRMQRNKVEVRSRVTVWRNQVAEFANNRAVYIETLLNPVRRTGQPRSENPCSPSHSLIPLINEQRCKSR